ncbi:MAG: hypothetical protein HZB35_01820, partial [Nitrospirae bacterium]|nr:hypothetical protein [Nitrospirota bacterium]
AMHEADHRFTVDGYVCGPDGKPVAETEVLVKDTRVTVGATVYTDASGHYKTTLHLHNDNVGDPLLIEAGKDRQERKIEFDPKDTETERRLRVDFGTGCVPVETMGSPVWVYYGLGLGAAAIAAVVGRRLVRQWGKDHGGGKGSKRKREGR